MAELLVAFVVAFVELIALCVQLCVQLVALVLESLGFAAGHLAEKPKEGEPRFSGKRLLIAFAPLAIVLVMIVGTFMFFDWRAKVPQAKEHETRQLIEDNIQRLAGNVDENGHFVRHPAEVLDVNDMWGNPLRVNYADTLLHESIEVKSDGADEQPNTIDDLSSSRRIMRPKKEIAIEAFDKAKDAIRDRDD